MDCKMKTHKVNPKIVLKDYLRCLIDLERFPNKRDARDYILKKYNISNQTLSNYLPDTVVPPEVMEKLRYSRRVIL
jgi:hypothetical protein